MHIHSSVYGHFSFCIFLFFIITIVILNYCLFSSLLVFFITLIICCLCLYCIVSVLEAPNTKTNSLCVQTHLAIKLFLILIVVKESTCDYQTCACNFNTRDAWYIQFSLVVSQHTYIKFGMQWKLRMSFLLYYVLYLIYVFHNKMYKRFPKKKCTDKSFIINTAI